MTINSNFEAAIIGISQLNEDIFLGGFSDSNITDGVYYSKIFMKPANSSWFTLQWIDNQNLTTTNINTNTLGKFKVEFRVRVGNNLPFNYTTNSYYDLATFNSLIQTGPPEIIDSLMYRMTLGRSLTASTSTNIIPPPNNVVFDMGSSFNTSQLASSQDALWSFWGLPIQNSPSYLFAGNPSFNYLQLRIALENIGTIQDPVTNLQHFSEIYSTTISSILNLS